MSEKEKKYFSLDFVKKEELKILAEFDRVCRKNQLRYSLSGGTLIGAVRHGGFIPWDDDVDVLMLREDYDRLCCIFQDEFPDNYFLQNYKTDKKYPNNFAKLLNLNIYALIEETEALDIKKGLCIDIFPIDRVTINPFIRKFDIGILSVINLLKYSSLNNVNENAVKRIIHRLLFMVARMVDTSRLNNVENKIRTKYNGGNSKITFADYIKPPYRLGRKDIYPYDIFLDYLEMDFEGLSLMAIAGYEQYLRITYGDYMTLPPEHDRVPGHNFYYYDAGVKT